GIIHRDLKPLNVMVGAFGEVQVMDWGLAKRVPREGTAPASSPEVTTVALQGAAEASATWPETVPDGPDTGGSRTQAGQVLGTLAFMAPEQARGEVASLDERCDVFGLGAILCTILTGRPPYQDTERQATWEQARAADLEDAWRSLETCGADA